MTSMMPTMSTATVVKVRLVQAFAMLVLLSIPCAPANETATPAGFLSLNTTLFYLMRTMTALKGTIDFFQRNHKMVNLDAVIGSRIVEGSLKVLLRNLNESRQEDKLPAEVTSEMWTLYHIAKDMSDAAEPHVAESEALYYHRIGPVIREGLWELNYPMRSLSSNVPLWKFSPKEAMTETQSDDCLTEFFGTGDTNEKCLISEKCWNRMTTLGYSQYSLSHQIFYLQIGELSGCMAHIVWNILMHNQPGLHVLQDTFCANMLREAESFDHAGLPAVFQDLFMEQGALCGMYGYYEFFRYDWLEHILGWQDPAEGCYKWAGWPLEKSARRNYRLKREERRLDGGCLCHRTTVAAAALVQYVRFLTEAYLEHALQLVDSPQ